MAVRPCLWVIYERVCVLYVGWWMCQPAVPVRPPFLFPSVDDGHDAGGGEVVFWRRAGQGGGGGGW